MKKYLLSTVKFLSLCAFLLPQVRGDVEVIKSIKDDLTEVQTGETFTYRLQYRGASTTTDFFNATLTDVLPEGLEFIGLNGTVHVDSFAYDASGRELTINFVDPLPAGSTGDIEVHVRFTPGSTPDGTVAVNTATAVADNSPPFESNPVTITARAENKATVDKQLLGSSVPLDQNVTYRVRLLNNSGQGALNLSDITVVDFLPPGAEFVDASHSGVYDPVEHTVTWTAGGLGVNSNLNRTVTVNFSDSLFELGDEVKNEVEITYTPLGKPERTDSAEVTHTIVAPQGAHNFRKSVANNYVYEGKEAFKTWTFTLQNQGNVPMENVVVTDTVPPQLEVTQIRTGAPSGTPSGLHDPIQVFYKTNLEAAWTGLPGNPYSGNNSQQVAVSGLGLAAGEYITEVKWEFGTLPVGYQVNDLRLVTTILTVDQNGDPVLEGDRITNAATLTYEDYRGIITDEDDRPVDVQSPRPVVNLIKNASPGTVDDGGTTTYDIRLRNDSLAAEELVNPVLADLLDEKLEFVSGSYSIVSMPAGAPDPIFELIPDYNGTGRTLLRWRWDGASAYSLPVGEEIRLRFDAHIPAGTLYGTIGNKVHLVGYDNPVIDRRSTGQEADVFDLNGNGNTSEMHPTQNRNITVRGRASMDSVKWVRGELDDDWHKYPDSGLTVPGGQADYRLIVKNTGNVPMHDVVVLDILPVIGDTGVIDLSQRDTEWIAALAGPVTAPPGVTVYYSRTSNPQRPDFVSSGPPGAVPPEWSTTPPATITDARALMFVFDSVVIQPAEEFELSWPMRAPVGTPTDGEIAWNSFGFYGTREDTGTNLLASEPIKVGIAIQPDHNAAYGDRVWLDLNQDGIQDPGEPGINGIRVYLYEDSGPGGFPDGIANPAEDRLVGFTVTSDNHLGEPGYYLFPDLDRGYYYAVFEIPDAYTVSPFQAGSDPELDSDVDAVTGMTPITYIEEKQVDLSWDLGLWLPPSSVSIVKTAGSADDGEVYWTEPNTPVTYTYTVTNTGDLPLVRIRVTDDKLGQVALLDGPIEPGESVVLTKTSSALSEGVVNIGFVEAYPADPDTKLEIPGGKPVTDDDPAEVKLYASIGDYVWFDQNLNGIQDSAEPGVENVVVTLYDAAGNELASQITGSDGKYLFDGLYPGDYRVGFAPPPEYMFVPPNAGSDPAKDSDADPQTGKTVLVTLEEGDQDMTWDAGLWKTASLGDYVWWDFNADGLQDGLPEFGVNGVTVNLLDAAGEPVLDFNGDPISTVTATGPDGEGYYIFDGLTPGFEYRVQFVADPGMVFTTQNADGQGINGANNSDADPDTGITDTVILDHGEHNPHIDAGILGNPEIALIKNVDKVEYSVDGEVLTYSFVVTNTGNVPLSSIMVTDPLFPVQGGPISLDPGEFDETTFSGTYNVTLADLNAGERPNEASVAGTFDATGEVVTDKDDVTVPALQLPELTVTKTGTYRSGTGDCDTLGSALPFNALIFGNMDAQGGDTDGRLAVAGDAIIPAAYSVGIPVKGDPIPPVIGSDTDMFIVGGDLVDGAWGVNGNIVFGGTRTGPVRYQPNGNVTRHVNPITFDADGNVPSDGSGLTFHDLQLEMQARSALFAALDDQGVVTMDNTQPFLIILEGNDPDLNVFNVDADFWSATSTQYHITAPAGSTVLVNIHGGPVDITHGGMVLNGVTQRTVLYNYVDAESLSTTGFTHYGSVLAPYASGTFSGGGIDGNAVFGGDVYTRNGFEFHNFPFEGSICVEVFYEFTVENTGNVTITDITIDDPVVPVEGGPVSLDPGEKDTDTFTAVYAIQPQDIYSGSFTNTATANGTAPLGDPVAGVAEDTLTFTIPGIGSGGGAGSGGSGGSGGSAGGSGVVGPPPPPSGVQKPDFVVQSVTLNPSPLLVNETFSTQVVVSNTGDVAGDAGLLRLWIAKAAIPVEGTPGDAQIPVGILEPGEVRTLNFHGLTAPADEGTDRVRVMIDADGATDEWSLGNNHGQAAYTLSDPASADVPSWMKPDFIVQSVELLPSPTVTGTRFAVRLRVKNIGDIPGDAGELHFWAANPVYAPVQGAPDWIESVGVLDVSEVAEFIIDGLVAPLAKGTFHARAVVDATGITDEKSEGNNHGGATYSVSPLSIEVSSEADGNHIKWNSAAGYVYTVERSTSLNGTFEPIAIGISSTPPKNLYIDDDPPAGPVFYRVWGIK